VTTNRWQILLLTRIVALLLACSLGSGCRANANRALTDAGDGPRYRRAKLVYELDAFQRPLPLSTTIIDPTTFEVEVPRDKEPLAGWTTAQLSIDYPHPDGDGSRARAVLRLSNQEVHTEGIAVVDEDSQQPAEAHEIWILDFPKQQLDLLLTDLNGSGFFQKQIRRSAGTFLDVRLDRGRTQKTWTPEPRLDYFVARVYCEGTQEDLTPGAIPDQCK
jgi:hypothetical protein